MSAGLKYNICIWRINNIPVACSLKLSNWAIDYNLKYTLPKDVIPERSQTLIGLTVGKQNLAVRLQNSIHYALLILNKCVETSIMKKMTHENVPYLHRIALIFKPFLGIQIYRSPPAKKINLVNQT